MADHAVGSKISLISKSEIRYEGYLHFINAEENTVGLRNVRMFGTEGRKGDPKLEIAPGDQLYDFIIFRGADIKDLTVFEWQPQDPAIVSAQPARSNNQSNSAPPQQQQQQQQQQNAGRNTALDIRQGHGGQAPHRGQDRGIYDRPVPRSQQGGDYRGDGGRGGGGGRGGYHSGGGGGGHRDHVDHRFDERPRYDGGGGRGGSIGGGHHQGGGRGGGYGGRGGYDRRDDYRGFDQHRRDDRDRVHHHTGGSDRRRDDRDRGGYDRRREDRGHDDRRDDRRRDDRHIDERRRVARPEAHTGQDFVPARDAAKAKEEFREDFDFKRAAEEFEKKTEDLKDPAKEDKPAATKDEKRYDKGSSFFDKISCETSERLARAADAKPAARLDREQQQKVDTETFGRDAVGSIRPFRHGRGRGRYTNNGSAGGGGGGGGGRR